jgi:hypothetical protein
MRWRLLALQACEASERHLRTLVSIPTVNSTGPVTRSMAKLSCMPNMSTSPHVTCPLPPVLVSATAPVGPVQPQAQHSMKAQHNLAVPQLLE